uniref:Uncharacterized protein n=1 Tax=Tetraselmis chuii TaxID=63592 RepID=A0A7S1SNM3_9CHLO|mmetsp:Transcript_21645/g.38581  ORF Transcript_21645/g.38581 Transcript_21645/m.38581 type:complete len:126 (+) Transcript_21645:89-466(+)
MFCSMRRASVDRQYVEVDMENAHFILLAGKYPDVTTIHDYIDNRERHLKDVQEACGVPRWAAKQFFLILIFGGTIATWRTEHNVSEDTVLPQICGDIFRCIAGLKADFETRKSENQVFAQAAKNK